MRWDLTVFAADNVTPILGVAAGGVVTQPSFSTDPTHPRPYLLQPTDGTRSDVDFLKGSAKIGQQSVTLVDMPTNPDDQRTGILTALLADQLGANGLRNRLTYTDDAGITSVVIDGPMSTPKLHASYAGYTWTIRDENYRTRKVRAFDRTGTTCVYPRGPLADWGTTSTGAPFLKGVRPAGGRFKLSAAGAKFGEVTVDGGADEVLTAAMEAAVGTVWGADEGEYRLDKVEVLWRPEHSAGAWTVLRNMIVPSFGNVARWNLFGVEDDTVIVPADNGGSKKVKAKRIRTVVLRSTSPSGVAPNIPANGQRVEVVVVYVGPASAEYPLLFSGPAGVFLEKCVRGDYSATPTGIRYHAPSVLALTAPCTAAVTAPVDDVLGWLEKEFYQPMAAAPTLNNDGELAPTGHALPPPGAVLPVIDDSVCAASSDWSHPDSNVVNDVTFTYYRDIALGTGGDPLGENSRGDGAGQVAIPVRTPPHALSLARFGPRPLTISTSLFRSGTTAQNGSAAGEAVREIGHLLGAEIGRQTVDRFAFGAPTFTAPCLRSATSTIRPGDWVELRCSWLPDRFTRMRGSSRLAQVVGIGDLDPVRRELRLLDGGDLLAPLAVPTLGGAVEGDGGVVRVPVTALPAGASGALVEYVLSAPAVGSAPATGWMPAGRATVGNAVDTPPLPANYRLWYRAIAAGEGRRSSAPTAPASILLAATPRLLSTKLQLDSAGAGTVTLERNAAALSARAYYAAHDVGSDPVFTAFVDTAALTLVLPIAAKPGQRISVEVEPWSGWTGAAVSGAAGQRLSAYDVRDAAEALAVAVCRALVVNPTATTVTVEVDATPAGATVYLYGLTGADRISGAALGVPVASGSQWTFSRGAPQGPMGQAVFRAELDGYQSDDDAVEIAEQGRDTVGLSMIAQVYSTTATTATVRVRVMDGQPQAPGSISILHTTVGGGSVSPSTQGLTVSPAASLVDDRAGYFRDYTITRPAFGTGTGRVTFQAYADGRVPDTDSVDVPAQEKDTVYAGCNAVVTDSSPTQITVQVTSSPAGATVELVGVTGTATLASGPAAGMPVASGQAWTFNRGAALGGLGQVQFRAKLTGYQSDDDTVDIAPQGRDTVGLSTIAQVYSTSATSVTVRVRVVDPQPQGADSIAIGYALVGAATIAPAAQGLTVSPAAALNDDRSGYFRDFIITRPAFKAGTARVSFIATAPNRTPSTDPVDIPAQEQDTLDMECRVSLVSSTATQMVFQVDAVPSTGSVQLVAVEGSATKAVGPAIGAVVASGQQYTINRGAPLGPSGLVRWRATAPGYQSDDGYGVVPEQGRDTVMLAVRAEVMASGTSASQVTVRVRVVDPYPTGGASVMVSYSAAGTGAVTPASGATLTPTASFSTTGYVDLVIQRAAAGSGGGRVTITVTANDRVPGVDAVDVAPLETPQRARPPVHATSKINASNSTVYWNIDGVPGEGGVGPVGARIVSDEGEELYEWTDVPFLYGQTMQPRDPITEYVELRDAVGNTSTLLPITAPASLPGIGPTGRTRRDVPMEGTAKTLGDVEGDAGAGRAANSDLDGMVTAGALDRLNRRIRTVYDESRGVAVTGAQAATGARLVDPADPLRLPASQTQYGNGSTVEALRPAEGGATIGARAGVNLVSGSGIPLGDAAIITAQGTAADTTKVGGRGAEVVRDEARYGKNFTGIAPESRIVNGSAELGTIAGWNYALGFMDVDPTVANLGSGSFIYPYTTPEQGVFWQDIEVRAGDVVTISAAFRTDGLTSYGGAGLVLNIDAVGGTVLLPRSRSGPYQPTADPLDVGIPADGTAYSFSRGKVSTTFKVAVAGSVRIHLHYGYGGNVQGVAWMDSIADYAVPEDGLGFGGQGMFPVENAQVRSWDGNPGATSGVHIAWESHAIEQRGRRIAIPGGSFLFVPGSDSGGQRVYALWRDLATGVSGYFLASYGGTDYPLAYKAASGPERSIFAYVTAAYDASGLPGGSSDPGVGQPGAGIYPKR